MECAAVQEELRVRSQLQVIIEKLLDRLYIFDPCTRDRLGRASVHAAVADRLNLVHNNTLSNVIKAALTAKGVAPSCSRGLQYYRGLRERNG